MSKYRVNSRLKRDGSVYEAGDEINLNDRVAEPLVTAGTISSGSSKGRQNMQESQETGANSNPEGDQYSQMSYNDLRDLAKSRNVRANGKREEVADRLREADRAEAEGNEEIAANL